MELLVRALLTYLLHSTLLLGAAALLRLALRERRLVLQEAVLRAALVGGFLTAGLQLGLGLQPLAGAVRLPAALQREAASPARRLAAARAQAGAGLALAEPSGLLEPVTPRASDALAGADGAPGARWPLALAAGWLVLGALALARLAVAASRLGRMLRGRRPIRHGELAPEAEALVSALGLWPRVRLSAAPRLAVPLATGVLRPEVCLPPRAVFGLGVEEQVALCAHELAHLARRDPAWLLLARVVEGLAPLQPLNTWARRRLQDLAELLSDDLAVSVSARPLGLARSLVDVAAWTLGEASFVPAAAVGALSARSRLGHRVERLMDPLRDVERPRRILLPAAACLVLLSSLVTPVVLGSAAPQDHVAPQAEAIPQAPPAPAARPAPPARLVPHAAPAPSAGPAAEAASAAAGRRLEELARQVEARAHAHEADLRQLEAELAAAGALIEPNEAEIEKLSRKIEASAAELTAAVAAELGAGGTARQGERAKAASRRMAKLQDEIRAATKHVRVPDEQLRALTDKARALAEDARPTREELREIHELSAGVARDAMRRAADEMQRAADELRAQAVAGKGAAEAPEPPRR